MSRTVKVSELLRVSRAWMTSAWMKKTILERTGREASFLPDEADALGNYLVAAQREAPTHGVIKYPHNLILELGFAHDGLVPGVRIKYLKRKFSGQAIIPLDANRKLGLAVMDEILGRAHADVMKFGEVRYLVHNAFHFGYGGLWARKLADMGLLGSIRNTSGRGCEVFPWGADCSKPENARMGTNPITIWFPTRRHLGFHFIADCATSSMSFGKLKRLAALGEPLPEGAAVDETGAATTDASRAKGLLFDNAHDYQFSLAIEALGALMGGGNPYDRCMRRNENPGGSCDWVITVADPEVYSCAEGDAMKRVSDILAGIVKNNGSARLPGSSALARAASDPDTVPFDPAAYAKLEQMAAEAEVHLSTQAA